MGRASHAYRFKAGAGLTPAEQKYCSCLISVAAKGTASPYGICAAATGASSRRCGASYNFAAFTDEDLAAYAALSGLEAGGSRQALLNAIRAMKIEKYGDAAL